MFEARLEKAELLKKVVEATRELVSDANFDCSSSGISLQAMDSSHVSLVGMLLRSEGFEHFRCDRNMSLGIKLASMAKVLKCAGNDDVCTIKAEDDKDTMSFAFEDKKAKKFADFDLKLMDIEADTLGIPDTNYKVQIEMPSAELQRIMRDLGVLGDSVTIAATKDGVKFSVTGELGTGNITLRQNDGAVDEDDDEDESMSEDNKKSKKSKGAKKGPSDKVKIDLGEPVTLTFACRYMNLFTRATSLSETVVLKLSNDVPLVVEYRMDNLGYLRFYLAPKIGEDGDE